MMKTIIPFACSILLLSTGVSAAAPELSDDQKAEMVRSFWNLTIADGCLKRFGDQKLYDAALASTIQVAKKLSVPNAEDTVRKSAKEMREKPEEPNQGFSISNEKSCAELKAKMGSGDLK